VSRDKVGTRRDGKLSNCSKHEEECVKILSTVQSGNMKGWKTIKIFKAGRRWGWENC